MTIFNIYVSPIGKILAILWAIVLAVAIINIFEPTESNSQKITKIGLAMFVLCYVYFFAKMCKLRK